MTADQTGDSGGGFARRSREPRAGEDLEVPPRRAFDAELDAITDRVDQVVSTDRDDFTDGAPSYDIASMAIIRLSGLFEVRRFGPFLATVTPAEQRAIKATRQYAAHGGYREMDDDELWHTITIDVPDLVARLRKPPTA